MTWLNLRISPKEASIMESKVSLSAGQEHSALATSKLSKMDELVNPSSIGCKMIRSRGLPIWIQVKISVAHLRSPHQAGMLALTVHGRQQRTDSSARTQQWSELGSRCGTCTTGVRISCGW